MLVSPLIQDARLLTAGRWTLPYQDIGRALHGVKASLRMVFECDFLGTIADRLTGENGISHDGYSFLSLGVRRVAQSLYDLIRAPSVAIRDEPRRD